MKQRPSQKTTASQKAALWSPVPMGTSTKHFHAYGSGNIVEEKPEDQGLCFEIVSPSNVREAVPIMTHKHDC